MEELESYNLLFLIDILVTSILYNIYILKIIINIMYVILFNNIILEYKFKLYL